MLTLRRQMALALLLVLGLLLATFVPASTAVAQDPPNASAGEKNLVLYTVDVLDKIVKHHPEGKKHTVQEFVDGAAYGVARAIQAKKDMPAEQRDMLVKYLREQKFTSFYQLLHLMDRFSRKFTTLNMDAVADAACMGAIKVTGDQFTRIMTMDELQKMQQMMQQGGDTDKSLGVAPMPVPGTEDDEVLRMMVGHVRRNYLGYDMGLAPHDEILAINGRKLGDIPRAELGSLMEAEVGGKVSITIKREGFDQPITVTGVQTSVDHPSARGVMLPCGKLGYIDTNMFSMTLHTDVKAAIDRLVPQGMKALILDLRNNPGGAMPACTELADYFLEPGKLITTTKGTYENPLAGMARFIQPGMDIGEKIDAETTVWKAKQANPYTFPVIVLVNHMSASASEMLSGCLKSWKRAVIVGETSYGKGIGQTAVMLGRGPRGSLGMMSMMGGGGDGMRMLYMTVMTYFLPHGEAVHHIGISPDVEVKLNDYTPAEFAKIAAFRSSGKIDAYLNQTWETRKDWFVKQLTGAPATLSEYPAQNLLAGVKGTIGDEQLERELRHAIAIRAGHANAMVNINDDNQLQEAIRQACKACGLDSKDLDAYRHIK
ncbi:MAG: S41 family peptidase [Planctomycetota bacterium]